MSLILILLSLSAAAADSSVAVGVPPEVLDPPWLESRRQAQVAAAAGYAVFCDFSFTDRQPASGLTFHHRIVDDSGRHYRPNHYDHGNGVALADVDGDGRTDLYFVNQAGPNGLWRNMGDGQFADITERGGVALADRIGVTASFADLDNDGAPDLYVTNVRMGNVLFRNQGDGHFADISQESGLDHQGHSSAALFFDYDRDGQLDLFLTNVGQYTERGDPVAVIGFAPEEQPEQYHYYVGFKDAFAGHLKPERTEPSLLFRNVGENRFVDVTEEVGIKADGWSGDAVPLDANEDGWPDLYVLNMQGHDQYYENDQGQHFIDKSLAVFPRTPWGAMSAQILDFDNDSHQDLYITDMHSDMSEDIGPEREKLKSRMQWTESFLRSGGRSIYGNAFYHRQADGTYAEISDSIGAENYWPWGLSAGDLNADGYEDVFITASMNYAFRYAVNSLLLNDRGKGFLDAEFALEVEPRREGRTAMPWFVLDCAGEYAAHPDCEGRSGPHVFWGALGSRASALADLDDDGDLDIVTNEFNAPPLLLISDLSDQKADLNFLKVRLIGTRSNRDGLGAVVSVHTRTQTYTRVHDGKVRLSLAEPLAALLRTRAGQHRRAHPSAMALWHCADRRWTHREQPTRRDQGAVGRPLRCLSPRSAPRSPGSISRACAKAAAACSSSFSSRAIVPSTVCRRAAKRRSSASTTSVGMSAERYGRGLTTR